MFTIRNLGGVALFLFGSTFLWLTPAFADPDVSTSGLAWSATQVLALTTVLGFSVATWGLFRRSSWWEGAALVSAGLGLLSLVPYWVAAHDSGETGAALNVLIHLTGVAVVFGLLSVPEGERWANSHVMSGH